MDHNRNDATRLIIPDTEPVRRTRQLVAILLVHGGGGCFVLALDDEVAESAYGPEHIGACAVFPLGELSLESKKKSCISTCAVKFLEGIRAKR